MRINALEDQETGFQCDDADDNDEGRYMLFYFFVREKCMCFNEETQKFYLEVYIMMYDFETRVAVMELKGILKELQRISIRAEMNLAWDNVLELPKELADMKKLIKHIDDKIKELETKNKVDEDELY